MRKISYSSRKDLERALEEITGGFQKHYLKIGWNKTKRIMHQTINPIHRSCIQVSNHSLDQVESYRDSASVIDQDEKCATEI